MNGKLTVITLLCLILSTAQAELNNPAVINASFEDPLLDSGASVTGINDWFDAVAYTYTKDEDDAIYPQTPYGENWAEMGNGRWFYQQIGTYSENQTYQVTFLTGQVADAGKPYLSVTVELLAGGDPALAADVNAKRDSALGTFLLDVPIASGGVGATVIDSSGPLNPFAVPGVAESAEMSIELNTGTSGTGYSVGDPLWLLFYRPSDGGRALVDNVAVTPASSDPYTTDPTPPSGYEHIDPIDTLSWAVANSINPTFDINIGTDSNCNDILDAFNTGSSQSYTPSAGLLNYDTQYFWRVDVTDGGTEYPGAVWTFTTGGKAYNPVPASGGTINRSTGVLSWTGNSFVTSYDVWFGLPGDLQFAGNVAVTSISFTELASALGLSYVPAGNYQWRVDTKDDTGTLMVTGDVWDITFPAIDPIVIDDFNGYNQTSELLVNWSAAGGAALAKHDFYGAMQINYDTQNSPYQSEATRTFASAQDWASTIMDTFVVTIRGQADNDPETLYCSLYDGTTTATVYYSQSDATTVDTWHNWYVRLSDFSNQGLNLAAVISITLGVGDGNSPGGVGTLYVDDLLIDLEGCIAAFQSLADLNKDCSVTFEDILMFAGDWLLKDFTVSPVSPDDNRLLAHYEFNESAGSSMASDSVGSYDAAVTADDLNAIWNTSGYSGGCLELDSSTEVTIPGDVFGGVTDVVTIAFWINGDSLDYPGNVNQALFAAGAISGDEYDWDTVAWDISGADAYGGQWNHYAVVKDVSNGLMKMLHNGVLVGRNLAASDAMEGTLAGDSILSMAHTGVGATTTVKIDDLRIYNYALSQAEVASLAGTTVTQPIKPMYTESDLGDDGSVNLPDFAVIAIEWLEQK